MVTGKLWTAVASEQVGSGPLSLLTSQVILPLTFVSCDRSVSLTLVYPEYFINFLPFLIT